MFCKQRGDKKLPRPEPMTFTTIDCESCGVMVRKEMAIRGKSEIRTKEILIHGFSGMLNFGKEEYIHIPYFCKRCAGKTEAVLFVEP